MSTLTKEKALAMLPDGDTIHTMLGGGGFMLGADWSRSDVEEAIANTEALSLSGDFATAIGHGIAIKHDGRWLFVETRKLSEGERYARDEAEDNSTPTTDQHWNHKGN